MITKGSALILLAIALWSSLGIVIRISGAPVHSLILYSSLISSALLAPFALKKIDIKRMAKSKNSWVLIILGPLALLNSLTFYYALKHATIANAVLTHYIGPIVVVVMAWVFLKERLSVKIILSVVLSSAGLWILLGTTPSEFIASIQTGDQSAWGMLSGIASAFTYAAIIITIRMIAQDHDPLVLTFIQNIVISVLLAPFAAVVSMKAAIWIIVLGIVHSTIAPVLYFKGMKTVTAGRAAVLGYIEPVCATILAALFLSEYPALTALIGGAMILFGGYMVLSENSK